MRVKRTLGTETTYKIQGFWSEQGEEPNWMGIISTTDYDEALVEYETVKNSSRINVPLRLISETVNIDVLEENE